MFVKRVLQFVLVLFLISQPVFAIEPQVSAGFRMSVGLKSDGTVIANSTYSIWDEEGERITGNEYIVDTWTDIIQVSAGDSHIVGLKSDGTVVFDGNCDKYRCFHLDTWTDIVQIAAGSWYTAGLRSDGTVIVTNFYDTNVWTNIVEISSGVNTILGLKSDGTVVAAIWNSKYTDHGQGEVEGWTDIVQAENGKEHTVGLKSDGTVVAVGSDVYGKCDVEDWTDIIQVSAGSTYTVGLKSDGTVVTVGINAYGDEWDIGHWSDIIQLSSFYYHTVGLRSDGSVVSDGYCFYNQCDVDDWNLILGNQEPPVSYDMSIITVEDISVDITLSADDPNVEYDDLTFTIIIEPTNGTILGNLPYISYVPTPGFFGNDSFTFQTNNGVVHSNIATVDIEIEPDNYLSVISSQISLGTESGIPIIITFDSLIVSDRDNEYPKDFTLHVQGGDNYELDGNIVTPDISFIGVIIVPVYVNDGQDNSNTYDLNITVSVFDACPLDPQKIVPGICGCGVEDIDTDKDGVFDCNDFQPVVDIIITPDSNQMITVGDSLNFSCFVFDGNLPYIYQWDFSNVIEESDKCEVENVVFKEVGVYPITLTVFDSDNDSDEKTVTIVVMEEYIEDEYEEEIIVKNQSSGSDDTGFCFINTLIWKGSQK